MGVTLGQSPQGHLSSCIISALSMIDKNLVSCRTGVPKSYLNRDQISGLVLTYDGIGFFRSSLSFSYR
jgi:hypothetical protein